MGPPGPCSGQSCSRYSMSRTCGPQDMISLVIPKNQGYLCCHCIDLMLEDMRKIAWIKEIVESARSVTIYIYMCVCVLTLMRQFTGNKELVRLLSCVS
jgi:hypothetical protein